MSNDINVKMKSEGVFFAQGPLVNIGDREIRFLQEKVRHTPRKSIRLCAHKGVEDTLHEMFILHSKETYVRPHKHPDKSVSYHIIQGAADLVLFNETGGIIEVIPMGAYGTGRVFFYRLNATYYYTPLVRSDFFLFHETTNGPFKPSDTVYAPWAAEEGDTESVRRFQRELLLKVDQASQK